MNEYGVGLVELDRVWTPGITLLMLQRMTERYRRQSRGQLNQKSEPKEMTNEELLNSDWVKG